MVNRFLFAIRGFSLTSMGQKSELCDELRRLVGFLAIDLAGFSGFRFRTLSFTHDYFPIQHNDRLLDILTQSLRFRITKNAALDRQLVDGTVV
jgi:hypothetical protein